MYLVHVDPELIFNNMVTIPFVKSQNNRILSKSPHVKWVESSAVSPLSRLQDVVMLPLCSKRVLKQWSAFRCHTFKIYFIGKMQVVVIFLWLHFVLALHSIYCISRHRYITPDTALNDSTGQIRSSLDFPRWHKAVTMRYVLFDQINLSI